MATGQDFVEAALGEIGIHAAETAIEAADMQLGINTLNDMLSEWDESGTPLGFTPLSDENDTVRIPRGVKRAVIVNLAGLLSVPFQKPISQVLAASIKSSNQALLRMTVKIGSVKVSSNLPRGSGNRDRLYDDRFYPEQDKANF